MVFSGSEVCVTHEVVIEEIRESGSGEMRHGKNSPREEWRSVCVPGPYGSDDVHVKEKYLYQEGRGVKVQIEFERYELMGFDNFV